MNFFEKQDHAKAKSKRMMFLFALGILGTMVAFDAAFGLMVIFQLKQLSTQESMALTDAMMTPYALGASAVVGVVMIVATIYKIMSLAGQKGEYVARTLGGTEIDPKTKETKEIRYRNIVEEMSLASGCPIPDTFILRNEYSINAFAAGHDIHDAAIAVSQGAINKLSRDELQGVVAHEFSHIFNGDMRINMNLMGWIHGLTVIAYIGHRLLRSRSRSSSSSKNKDITPLIGLVLLVVGGLGSFIAGFIRSLISKEREYLADATSIQYTRNPDGIGGTLKKIYALEYGSRITDLNASDVSHFLFADGGASGFFSFSTHPDIEDRLKAIYPNFSWTRFTKGELEDIKKQLEKDREERYAEVEKKREAKTQQINSKNVASFAGTVTPESLLLATQIMYSLSNNLTSACRNRGYAPFICQFLFLNHTNEEYHQKQLEIIGDFPKELHLMMKDLVSQSFDKHLYVLELLIPTLKTLSSTQKNDLLMKIKEIILIDNMLTQFEHHLFVLLNYSIKGRDRKAQRYVLQDLLGPASYVFSYLAHKDLKDPSDAEKAYTAGLKHITINEIPIQSRESLNLQKLDVALNKLSNLKSYVERLKFLEACMKVAVDDKTVTQAENYFMRMISKVLGAPLPPIN